MDKNNALKMKNHMLNLILNIKLLYLYIYILNFIICDDEGNNEYYNKFRIENINIL